MEESAGRPLQIPDYLYGKTIAILGYSGEGQEYARLLRDNEIPVVIGLRPIDNHWEVAERDGFIVKTLWEAVESANIIQVW
jgi:ketol-acid reductoisomerase